MGDHLPISILRKPDVYRDPGKREPTGTGQALREIRNGIVVMWWSFFDWLAVISCKALLLGVHSPTDLLAAVCIGMLLPLAIGIVLESWRV